MYEKKELWYSVCAILILVLIGIFVYALTPLATIDSLFINSTKGTNFTNENLTAFISVSNGANNSFIYDWRENNNSLMLLNLGMECDFNNKSRVTDYSTWKNNGTVSNAKDLNCSIFGGYNNLTTNSSGWIFNGINGSVRIEENTNLDLTRNFSYGAWFIMYSQPINGNSGVFSNAEVTGDDDGYNLEVSSAVNAGITCDLYNTNTLYRADMNAQASINKWYFAVCVMNDTSVTLYIDGVLKETTTASIRHQTTSKPLLGHYYVDGATNLYFNGTIDNLFVINKSLNTSEVVAMNSSGNYNNLLHSSQLTLLNNYSVVITPNNGSIDANTSFSNNIFIWDNMTTTLNNITDNYRNIVNATSYGVVNQNASFLVSGINDTRIESVWIVIWKDTRTLGNKIFEGLMSMTGPYWQGNMTLNNSFGRVTNYTIYVNDTGGNINLSDGSFLVNHLGSLNLFINSTYGTNFTNENLSVQNIVWTEEDNNSQNLSLIYDWRENNKSIAVLNLGMECDSNKSLVKDYSTWNNNGTVSNKLDLICNRTGGFDLLNGNYNRSNSSGWVFNGINDTVIIEEKTNLDLTRNFSYGAWFRLGNISNNNSILSNLEYDTDNRDGYTLRADATKGIACLTASNGAFVNAQWTKGYPIEGRWYFAVCTMNDTSISIYVNGVFEVVNTTTIRHESTNRPMLGKSTIDLNNNYFNGTIDSVFIINKTLTGDDIIAMNYTGPSINLLHSNITSSNNNYSVAVTPNDGFDDGFTFLSNNLFIVGNVSITLQNITDQFVNIINTTTYGRSGENVTFSVNVSSNLGSSVIGNVRLVVWKTIRSAGNMIFSGLMHLVNGFWQYGLVLNDTFGRVTNYTIFVNDTDGSSLNSTDYSFLVNHLGSLNLFINSTYGTNFTNENLSVQNIVWTEEDNNSQNLSLIYDWRENNKSIAVLNLGMECDSNKSLVKDYSTWNNNGTVSNKLDLICNRTGGFDLLNGNYNRSNSSAWVFNGINDTVIIEEKTNLDLTRNFSYGAWIIAYSQPINGNSGVFSNAESTGDDDGYNLEVSSAADAGITCDLYNTNTLYRADMNAQASINKWYFAVCVMNDTSVTLYIDGVLKETTTASIRHQTTSKPLLGHYYVDGATNLYFNGTIDSVFIINKTLTGDDIIAMNYTGPSINLLYSNITNSNNNYSVAVTLNDGFDDGFTFLSNNIYLNNSLPTNVSLVIPLNNTLFNSNNIYLNWSASLDNDSLDVLKYHIQVDNDLDFSSLTYDNDTIYTNFTNVTLTDARYYWRVIVNDGQANSSWSINRTFFIDATFPTINITSPTSTTYSTSSVSLQGNVGETNLDSCWYTINNGVTNTSLTCNTGSFSTTLSSLSGTYRVFVYANDSLNNENSTNVSFTVSIPSAASSTVTTIPGDGGNFISEEDNDLYNYDPGAPRELPSFNLNIKDLSYELKPMGFLKDSFTIKNNRDYLLTINIEKLGEIVDIIELDKDGFVMTSNSQEEISYNVLANAKEGIYVGSLRVESNNPYILDIPVVVTVDGMGNVIDISLSLDQDKYNLNSILKSQISLVAPNEGVSLRYFIKDLTGKIVYELEEDINDQDSILKTFENLGLQPGMYVFGVEAYYGDEFDADSRIFEINGKSSFRSIILTAILLVVVLLVILWRRRFFLKMRKD